MSLLLIATTSIIGIILGKLLFRKWVNHLTLYCIIWGVLVFLYELKFLPYPDFTPLTWFFIISAFLSFLFGVLTIISAKNLIPKVQVSEKSNMALAILIDDGKALKYSLFFFSLICLYGAIQNWIVLINMFGSIPAVLINANRVYRLIVEGEMKGFIPYISAVGYVAVFFSGIYTAYKGRFSFLTFFPFIGIIIRELASVGRAGMLFALMEFVFSFFLFRHLLNNESSKRFKFSRKNAILASTILAVLFIASASFVRISRVTFENYRGASKELRQLEENMIISPSIYLYLSSTVGVLNQYLRSEGENTGFGKNTFLPVYDVIAKFGIIKRPPDYQKGYYIPMWSNTATYIRELHADFGIAGTFLGPYLIGLLITWLWFKFYSKKSLIVFAVLVFLYMIIGFSFLVMVTRLVYWFTSLFIIIFFIPILEKMAGSIYKKSSQTLT